MTRSITQTLVDSIHPMTILHYDLCANAQLSCAFLMDKKLTLNFDSVYPPMLHLFGLFVSTSPL